MKKNEKERLYELKKKKPGVAVGLSLLITGLGHLYIGEYMRGFVCLITQVTLWIFLLGWIIWFLAPLDAYFCAMKHNAILRIEMGLKEE